MLPGAANKQTDKQKKHFKKNEEILMADKYIKSADSIVIKCKLNN